MTAESEIKVCSPGTVNKYIRPEVCVLEFHAYVSI